MLKELNALFALTPFLVMFAGYMWNYNTRVVAKMWTVDNCVMEKWGDFVEKRPFPEIPSVQLEESFREECWEQMGASLN